MVKALIVDGKGPDAQVRSAVLGLELRQTTFERVQTTRASALFNYRQHRGEIDIVLCPTDDPSDAAIPELYAALCKEKYDGLFLVVTEHPFPVPEDGENFHVLGTCSLATEVQRLYRDLCASSSPQPTAESDTAIH